MARDFIVLLRKVCNFKVMNFPLNIFRLPVIENTKRKTNDKGGQKYVTSFPNFQDHILKPYKIPIAQLTCRGGGEVPCLFQTP